MKMCPHDAGTFHSQDSRGSRFLWTFPDGDLQIAPGTPAATWSPNRARGCNTAPPVSWSRFKVARAAYAGPRAVASSKAANKATRKCAFPHGYRPDSPSGRRLWHLAPVEAWYLIFGRSARA